MNAAKTTERLVRQLSCVRQKKILQIKSKISSGKYKVNNLELAKALFLAN